MNCPESAVKRCLGGRQSVGGDEAGGITSIGEGAFKLCPNLTDVYCGGSESQWKQISIDPTDNGNAPLPGAAIHYNGAVPGSREPAAENPFADSIPASFRKAAIWAYEKGLVSGTVFGSSTPCTRGQIVTFPHRAMGK